MLGRARATAPLTAALLWAACGPQHGASSSEPPAPTPGSRAAYASTATASSAGAMEAQPASDPAEPEQPGTAKPAKASPLVGRTTREAIVQAEPRFAPVHAPSPDAASVAALARAEPGALVLVVLGTWCGDSRRELSRWFRALDAVEGELPFDVQYVAVDRAKNAPGESLDGLHIRYVPTFVVRRDAREVGRVVESAPRSIETAVAALLHGEASGTISDRADLP